MLLLGVDQDCNISLPDTCLWYYPCRYIHARETNFILFSRDGIHFSFSVYEIENNEWEAKIVGVVSLRLNVLKRNKLSGAGRRRSNV